MAKTLQTGSINIKLASGMNLDGAKVMEVTMREPTVDDQMNVQGHGTEAEQEVKLIANLCMVTPQDIRSLTLRDYTKVKAAFMGFID